MAQLRADLEWSEADRARLADDNADLRRQLKSAQRASRSESSTTQIPIILPGGHRLLTTVVAPGGASLPSARPS
jgi:hypothetical protein